MDAEDFKEYREAQQLRRKERLPVRQQEIEALSELGYEVKRLTDYQYRINGFIDLYPIHNRWHNLKTGKRGSARKLSQFLDITFTPTDRSHSLP